MRVTRVLLAGAAAALAVSVGSASPGTAASTADPVAAHSARTGVAVPGPSVALLAGPGLTVPTLVADASVAKGQGAQFTVTYHGFSAAAKASFQRAVNYWKAQVSSPVPITVDATWTPLGSGVLGSARAGTLRRDFVGAPKAGTWYSEAVANRRAGVQIDPSPDIVASFNSSFPSWSFTRGAAGVTSYDFQSVVTHELGHGLGFAGVGRVDASGGTVRLSGYPSAYDRPTESGTGTGKKLVGYLDGSSDLATALQSGNLVFDTTLVRQANGGKPARLYSPSTWQQGSSYSHLDETTFGPGRIDSLMTPVIRAGETIRSAGPVTMAVLKAAGW